jgi:hypothetical protein
MNVSTPCPAEAYSNSVLSKVFSGLNAGLNAGALTVTTGADKIVAPARDIIPSSVAQIKAGTGIGRTMREEDVFMINEPSLSGPTPN